MNAVVAAGSLSRLLRDSVSLHAAAGRIALVGPFGEVSYAALGESIDAFAAAAAEWKVGRGELVGIIAGRTVTRHGRDFPVAVAAVPGGVAIVYVRRGQ